MSNLWKYSGTSIDVLIFSKKLGENLEKELKKEYNIEIILSPLDRNSGASLYWKTDGKYVGELMITKSKSEDGSYNICRWSGIVPCKDHLKYRNSSSPKQLRNAASVYDFVDSFLEKNYGEPKTSIHHNNTIFKTKAEVLQS